MSSGNVFEGLFKQLASISKMVVDGVRDPKVVSRALQVIIDGTKSVADQFASWKDFYLEYFQTEIDLSKVVVPERKPGFDRLIVVVKGLTSNMVFRACSQHFPCWRYREDLDAETKGRNDREATETYAIWVRDCQEADKNLKCLSAEDLKARGVQGITLLERLLLELKYWSETGQHLDIQNITLCAGSRFSDGGVPGVDWHDGELRVHWYRPQYAHSHLRARSVVSSRPAEGRQ